MNTPDRYDTIRKKLRPKRRWRMKLRPIHGWRLRQFIFPALLVVMTVATMAFVGQVQYTQYRAQQEQEATEVWLTGVRYENGGYRQRGGGCEFPF
jgi:hypothetical protein